MLNQEYIEIYRALLERIAQEDLDSVKAKNVAVLVKMIDKKKHYLDFEFIGRQRLEMQPDRKQKEKMEIMPLRKLQEYLQQGLTDTL